MKIDDQLKALRLAMRDMDREYLRVKNLPRQDTDDEILDDVLKEINFIRLGLEAAYKTVEAVGDLREAVE